MYESLTHPILIIPVTADTIFDERKSFLLRKYLHFYVDLDDNTRPIISHLTSFLFLEVHLLFKLLFPDKK